MFSIAKGRPWDHDKEIHDLLTEYITGCILSEIRQYYCRDKWIFDELVPFEKDARLEKFSPELQNVFEPSIRATDREILQSISSYGFDPYDFHIRKFVQLIRMLKSPKEFVPDVYHEMILHLMGKNARRREYPFIQKEYMTDLVCRSLRNYYMPDKERAESLCTIYTHAFFGFADLLRMNTEYNIHLVFRNADIQYLYTKGLTDIIGTLNLSGRAYEDNYFTGLFTSIGYAVPNEVTWILDISPEAKIRMMSRYDQI